MCSRAPVPDRALGRDITTWAALPPGRPILVFAGEATELRVDAEALLPGEAGASDVAPALSLVRAPAALEALLVARSEPTRPWTPSASNDSIGPSSEPTAPARSAAALWLSPPRAAVATRHEVVLEARLGERVARRTIEVVVLPAASANRPPSIDGPTRVVGPTFDESTTDLDGDAVTLTVVSPEEQVTSRARGDAAWSLAVGGELPTEVLPLATDARGARTLRRVQVVAPERVAPTPGIIDALQARELVERPILPR